MSREELKLSDSNVQFVKPIQKNILSKNILPEEYKINIEEIVPDKYMSFTDIKDMMNTKFGYNAGELANSLDIISAYLKTQKVLYLEAHSYCEFYLYRLTLPTILISSMCSVISGIFNTVPMASIIVAGATAFNAFLLSVITYLKLDAKAEAHKMTAYSFDQLISYCEFNSGKILLSSDDKESNNGIKYDLVYIQKFISEIEKTIKEIKEKNQFLIPEVIRERYIEIESKNIFSTIYELKINELILLNELKVIVRDSTTKRNIVKMGDTSKEANDADYKAYIKKNEKIKELLEFRKEITKVTEYLTNYTKIKRYSGCCRIFY
jgi:hypothetical protein